MVQLRVDPSHAFPPCVALKKTWLGSSLFFGCHQLATDAFGIAAALLIETFTSPPHLLRE